MTCFATEWIRMHASKQYTAHTHLRSPCADISLSPATDAKTRLISYPIQLLQCYLLIMVRESLYDGNCMAKFVRRYCEPHYSSLHYYYFTCAPCTNYSSLIIVFCVFAYGLPSPPHGVNMHALHHWWYQWEVRRFIHICIYMLRYCSLRVYRSTDPADPTCLHS